MLLSKIVRHLSRPITTQISQSVINTTGTAIAFPGQGAQYVGMAADLYKDFTIAKQTIDESESILNSDIRKIMFEGPIDTLTLTENTQPAILSHSIAVLRVLESEFGLDVGSFSFALGHSLGEYTALVATKSLSFHDALKLVKLRGRSMQESIVEGETCMRAMVINGNHLEDLEELLKEIQSQLPNGEVAELSNINSRTQIVLSGTSIGVAYANSILHTKGFAGRAIGLPVSAPFHCSLMSKAQSTMRPALVSTNFLPPTIPIISNVSGLPYDKQTPSSSIAKNLVDQIVKTVQWQKSILYCVNNGVGEFVVPGPSRVLGNLLTREWPKLVVKPVATIEDLKKFKYFDLEKQ